MMEIEERGGSLSGSFSKYCSGKPEAFNQCTINSVHEKNQASVERRNLQEPSSCKTWDILYLIFISSYVTTTVAKKKKSC